MRSTVQITYVVAEPRARKNLDQTTYTLGDEIIIIQSDPFYLVFSFFFVIFRRKKKPCVISVFGTVKLYAFKIF